MTPSSLKSVRLKAQVTSVKLSLMWMVVYFWSYAGFLTVCFALCCFSRDYILFYYCGCFWNCGNPDSRHADYRLPAAQVRSGELSDLSRTNVLQLVQDLPILTLTLNINLSSTSLRLRQWLKPILGQRRGGWGITVDSAQFAIPF